MARKTAYEQSLATDGWTLFDPMDSGILERLSKKDILEGEEKLMLACWGRLLNIFRNMSLQRMRGERNYSKKRKSGFWTRTATGSILLKISVRSLGYTPITCVRGCCAGRRQGSSIMQSVSTFIAHVDIEADDTLLLTSLPSLWLLLRLSFTPSFKPTESTVRRWFVYNLPLRD